MNAIRILCALLVFAAFAQRGSAQTGAWTSHTSMQAVQTLAVTPQAVYAGTSGGVFSLDRSSGELSSYTIVDGMHSVDVNTIAADDQGILWIGYSDGVIDRLDPATRSVETYRDIERAEQFSTRTVRRMGIVGSDLIVATGFGLVVFDVQRREVRDTYSRLGTFNPGIEVRDFSIEGDPSNGTLWLATSEGVAYANLSQSNLQDPGAWSNDAQSANEVFSIAAFEGSIYTGTETGVYRRQVDGTYAKIGSSSEQIQALVPTADRLFAVGQFNLYAVESGGLRVLATEIARRPGDVEVADDGTVWIGDLEKGLVRGAPINSQSQAVEELDVYVPDGPIDGRFSRLAVAPDGFLAAGGVPGPRLGFYTLDVDGRWTSYTVALTPEIGTQGSFQFVAIDQDRTVWAGSVGGGVTSVDRDGGITHYDEQNSSLLSAAAATNFIITGGIATDASNHVWVSTLGSSVPLHLRSPDGTWTPLGPYVGDGLNSRSTAFGRIFVDSFGQKWIIVRDESSFSNTRGLMVLDTKGTPADDSDDSFRFFGSVGAGGQGLPSVIVTSVVEDRDGLVWVGTEEGLAYFVNTGIVAEDPNATPIWPQRADRSEGIFLLFGLRVNCLAVDPANRIWVGTDEGIRIIQSVEGGFEEVLQITTDNAPLPSDQIVDISVHPASGRVYVATAAGMVSTRGVAIEPVRSADDLFVFPNPVDMRVISAPEINIEGLVEETTISIVDGGGRVVRRFDARGGRALWDGRDESGAVVASGVYVVVAVGANGEGAAYGKVAIIN